jgi:hypothetical protein
MSKPFEAGQRVRVYGRPGPDAGCWSGTIEHLDHKERWGDAIVVKSDFDHKSYAVHPKQCRLLKPKKVGERKRVELLANIREFDGQLRGAQILGRQEVVGNFYSDNKTITLTETRPGEALVSREALAKAFWEAKKEATNGLSAGMAPLPQEVLDALIKALGLPAKGTEGKP